MKAIHLAWLAALVAIAAVPATSFAQARIDCESRDYQYNFCSTPDGVARARLVEQRSRSSCIEGRSWGWDRRGIWVSQGCEGTFEYTGMRPAYAGPGVPPGGALVVGCESRGYGQEFCVVPQGVASATLARQRSGAPCIFNQTWGWRPNGIWVSQGCGGDFEVNTEYRPQRGPSRAGHLVCESRDYRYAFCDTGRIRDAQLVDQRS